jgi:signal transduction histidine kinase/DNA-binding response OmpR family regulator/methyl-accepting chemotaxis protein
MLKNMKIGNRLFAGFFVVMVCSVTISIVAIVEINNIYNDTRILYEQPHQVSNYLREIKINALNIRRFMLDIVLLEDSTEINELIAAIDNEEKEALKKFEVVRGMYFGNKEDLDESYRYFTEYRALRDDIFRLKLAGDSRAVSEMASMRNRNYVAELFTRMQIALDNTELEAQNFYQSALETKKSVMMTLVFLLALMLTLSLVVAVLITRSIVVPLSLIVGKIKDIAAGNLGNEKLPEAGDELGNLATSYNEMQEDLFQKALIARKIAEGDFSAQAVPGSEKDILADSINRIAHNFDLVVMQAKKVAEGDFGNLVFSSSQKNPLVQVISGMLDSLKEVVEKAKQVAGGDYSGEVIPKSKSDELALSLNKMTQSLRVATGINMRQSRLKSAQNELNDKMRGDLSISEISDNIVSYAASYTNSQVGALYIYNDEQDCFTASGTYAVSDDESFERKYRRGESLIGQAAAEKKMKIYSDLPEDFLKIRTGIIEAKPRNILVTPFIFNNAVAGVMELGSLYEYDSECLEFLELANESMAISLFSAMNRVKLTTLLEKTTSQAEELQVQQEELREINEELESQTAALKASEEYLKAQQEELRTANEELEEKSERLGKSKILMEQQNRELEQARYNLEIKARELEVSGKYKTEFLANMSHELRTPLNSLLILAQTLMENKPGNMDTQQVEAARIIWHSGNDLLNLINEILDLSKVESGKMNISFASYPVSELADSIRNYFLHVATEKQLEIKINIPEDFTVVTDEQRINQIVRNLVSNAIKFTDKGGIDINIYKVKNTIDLNLSLKGNNLFAISIKDTGIGIPEERQKEIFEAFQQVDGSISRRYGGTGLGLTITRELTKLLGGEIKLRSEIFKGSEFTVYLPVNPAEPAAGIAGKQPSGEQPAVIMPEPVKLADDRSNFSNGVPGILIIEDDPSFAALLINICKQKGIKYLFSGNGEEGLILAEKYVPKGIILDIKLPGINGWEVLHRLKNSPATRHIPVHVISVFEDIEDEPERGVWRFLQKPVTKEALEEAFNELRLFIDSKKKKLLLVEDDHNIRKSTKILLKGRDIQISECGTAHGAFKKIADTSYDCLVLDLGLPDMSGLDLLKKLRAEKVKIPPLIIYTGKELDIEEHCQIQQYTRNIIIKGGKSEARLLDETSLFLHRVVDEMPENQKKMMINLYNKDEIFKNKTVLIVDDDMRNVFALTGVLETNNMKVHVAVNGLKALEFLEKNDCPDLVLMDIMMPVMDGYEAIRRIRMDKKYDIMPVIALTAKAMKEDRAKSIAAGANDYLSKPVDLHKLFNIMRIWLYR